MKRVREFARPFRLVSRARRTSAALAFGASLFAFFAFAVAAWADDPAPAPTERTVAAPAVSAAVAPENDFGADIQGDVPGAAAIEGRLMAPCCWTQTIDIHDSEISLSMRHEIRRRLRNGESPDTIQASFVERYGPKILAVQPNSPLKGVFIGLSVVMGGAGIASALMIGRWRKQSTPKGAPETKRSEARDKWDDKLDAELKDLEDDDRGA